jgi:hypothetical protein
LKNITLKKHRATKVASLNFSFFATLLNFISARTYSMVRLFHHVLTFDTTRRRASSCESSGKAGEKSQRYVKLHHMMRSISLTLSDLLRGGDDNDNGVRRAGQTGREGKAKVRSLKSSKSIEFLEGSGSRSGNSATPLA